MDERGRLQMQHQIDDMQAQIDMDEATTIAALEADGLVNRDEIANLTAALQTCRRIGAAVGILMATYQVSEAKAFAVLGRTSQEQNIKLRHLATQVIAEIELPNVTKPPNEG